MDELEAALYVHITNQTLSDNTILISNQELAENYGVPTEIIEIHIQRLIDKGYIKVIRPGYYSVLFGKLDEKRVDVFNKQSDSNDTQK